MVDYFCQKKVRKGSLVREAALTTKSFFLRVVSGRLHTSMCTRDWARCANGRCDPAHDTCICRPGWTGDRCDARSYPSCDLSHNRTDYVPCESIRRISPVSCDCLKECLETHELCAPGSFGCEKPWRRHAGIRSRAGFFGALMCVAYPVPQRLRWPLSVVARNVSLQRFLRFGYEVDAPALSSRHELVPFEAGMRWPTELRSGGKEALPEGARFVSPVRCGGCNGRGQCVRARASLRCLCIDGTFGRTCEHTCRNDCFNHCSARGVCHHGWCQCDPGWFGIDCSLSMNATARGVHRDSGLYAQREPSLKLSELPSKVARHARRARRKVYVYDLPPHVNQFTEMWMAEQWGEGAFERCAPVHERRIYSSQAHFESRLLHDTFVRTANPEEARLFYVPTFFLQRYTWNAHIRRPMLRILRHIRTTYPYWNRSAGRDHVWFVSGERTPCYVPRRISSVSVVIGLWGDRDCVDARKDIVVPSLSPKQHDIRRFRQDFLPFYAEANRRSSLARGGPLLFFSGGIFSFGASQDNVRPRGVDTEQKTQKWETRVRHYACADANATCRSVYSMGVRQALYKYGLHRERDVRIVSAGVPDYQRAIEDAQFCLHTEGNSWGTRIVDYMAFGCVPVIVNDRMLFAFADVLPYDNFSLHFSKRDIPALVARLRSRQDAEALRRGVHDYKRAFVWWSDVGLAYEYTIAALGYKLDQRS